MLLADDAAPPPAAQATDGQPLKTFPVIGENDPAKAPPPDHPVEPLKEVAPGHFVAQHRIAGAF